MKVDDRPFSGTWSLDIQNKYRTVTSWTPDVIVQFNGSTELPGCPTCKNRIDFSSFITSVSASGGIDSGGASCDISLIIPKSYGDVVYVDGKFILDSGIEIKVYFRGFFKTKDLSLKGDVAEVELSTESGYENIDLNEIETRPYYPVFHGFISQISITNKDNAYSVRIQTSNILSLWDSQMINTQQGYFAANPKEARGTINLNGHVYTNMTAHQIIYDLYLDTGGSPEGTSFALQQRSNLISKLSTGQEKYSLYLRFLENRWANGLYGLRMFGASGRAYTLLEQSLLVDPSPTGKDNEYKSVVKEQLKPHSKSKRSVSSALNNMIKVGMVAYDPQGRVLRTLDVRQLPSILGDKEDAVNVLSLQNFVTDINSLGQVQFFESQFESKLSIARAVAEKVGYEFYQDMDGDLVFKPPMINMDTSQDRVYRINREDIISLDYEHNIPEFTYVICSGGPFRNLKGTNLEGEWGVKGMYVDYKLVAKYGWKSMQFDTTYYNSARKAFYAAVVALDNANKATEGCNVSIPLRPEIRPGYPIYIEENDCFYYVEAVNHNFSYGGECTTSLTLTAQRKKFIPPGRPDISYSENPSEAVDLGDTGLPPKNLYTIESRDNSYGEKISVKKVVGFPNVVMALDPFKMNPETLTYAIEYQNIGYLGTETREAYRNMLLMEGKRYGVIQTAEGGSLFEGPWTFKIGDREGILGVERSGTPYLSRLKNGKVVKARISSKQSSSKSIILGESALDIASYNKRKEREKAVNLLGKAKTANKNNDEAEKIIDEAEKKLKEALYSLTHSDDNNPNELFTIYDLILAIRKKKQENTNQDEGLRTSEILRLLDNKKSSFAPHLPGYYRYYSSSHPSREHQGPYIPSAQSNGGELPEIRFDPPGIADPTDVSLVVSDPLHGKNSVVFKEEKASVVAGINTRTLYTEGFSYVPTKDIKTLTFQVNQTLVEKTITEGISFDSSKWEVDSNFGNAFKKSLTNTLITSLKKGFRKEEALSQVRKRIFNSRSSIPSGYPNSFYSIPGEVLDETWKIGDSQYNITSKDGICRALTIPIVNKLMSKLQSDFPSLFKAPTDNLEERSKEIIKLLNVSQKVFKPYIKGSFYKGQPRKRTVREFKNGEMVSPVFPISDDKGYEVFGAYQYGRGLTPAKNTLFDAILKQDPTRIFTQSEINEIRDSLAKYDTVDAFRNSLKKRFNDKISEIYDTEGRGYVQEIYKAYGLDIDDESGDPERGFKFDTLANRMMTRSDEQVIQNAPTSLQEIRPSLRETAMCSCKGTTSEASLLYASVNLEESIVEIENPIIAESLRVSKDKAISWTQHQEVLRANDLSTSPSRGNGIRDMLQRVEAATDRLSNIATQIEDTASDLVDKEKYQEAYNRRNNK